MKTTLISFAATSLAVFALGLACDRTPGASAAAGAAPAAGPAASTVETAAYKLEIKPVGTYKKGQPATFEVILKTKGDQHVNEEYPTKFKAAEGAGITYEQPKLEKMKHADAFALEKCASGKDMCTLKITVKFTPDQAGAVKVGGELNVGVCNKETCLVEKKTLDLSINVT